MILVPFATDRGKWAVLPFNVLDYQKDALETIPGGITRADLLEAIRLMRNRYNPPPSVR